MTLPKTTVEWIEWIAPIFCILGAILTAYDIYPLNKYLFIIGNGALSYMFYIWRKWMLFFLNFIVTITYMTGLIYIGVQIN